MSTWNPVVKTFVDNVDPVDATTVNQVIAVLASRDQYLFERAEANVDKSLLLAYNLPAEAGLTPGTVVYLKAGDETNPAGLVKKALATYQTSVDPSHLIPDNSAFVLGLVKEVYSSDGTYSVDVYLKGVINSNSFTLAALADQASIDSGKTNGPLYLSSLEAGKLTFYPGGSGVFVGYLINDGQLILSPNIDSLNQLYFNYKVYLAPRAAGTPVEDTGSWAITSSVFTEVGWVDAAEAASNYNYDLPAGAQFFYNLPSAANIQASVDLTDAQKRDALLLKEALPAYPAAFTMLFLNGVLQHMYDADDHTDGIFLLNGNGLWWFSALDEYKPWAEEGEHLNLVLQTTKLNPNYKASVVSSLQPYNDSSNNTAAVLSIVGANTKTTATAGDLLLKFNPTITASSVAATGDSFLRSITYNQVLGRFEYQSSPGVKEITVGAGLQATNTSGVVNISLDNFALSGVVDDIEPEEADFVYKGLHSYLRLKNPAGTQRIGFVGKFRLPAALPANTSLKISLLAFNDQTQTSAILKTKFEYAITKAGADITDAVVRPNAGADILATGVQNYRAQTILNNTTGSPCYEIPASALEANAHVNFRISRVYSDTFTANLGVLGVYWTIA